MLRAILGLFPPDLEVDGALATVLQLSDPDMSRLLGISLCHSSFLDQTGHGEWAAALRLLELFGLPLLRMAVAHTIHLSGTVTTAGEASRQTDDAIEPLRQELILAFHVRELAKFGRSVSSDPSLPSQGMLRSLAHQVAGAYTICLGYSELLRFIEPYCEFQGRPDTGSHDFKTALLEYSQTRWGTQPKYTLVGASGPEHARTFTVEVNTGGRRLAVGTGNRRRTAEQSAARQFLSTHAPSFVSERSQHFEKTTLTSRVSSSAPPALSSERRTQLTTLAGRLGVGASAVPLLDRALTHSSFHKKNRTPSDNTLLAHLGSQVLNGIASEILLTVLVHWPLERLRSYDPLIVIAEVLSSAHIEQGFDVLRLSALLQTASSVRTVLPSMRAGAFQAVIAATLLSKARPKELSDVLSDDLYDWLEKAVDQVAGLGPAAANQKSRLQEYLQALRLIPQYVTTVSGPEHAPRFRATVNVSVPGAAERFRIWGDPAKRKSIAEQEAARAFMALLETLLGASQWPSSYWANPTVYPLGRALLVYASKLQPARPKSWQRINMLCAQGFAIGDWLRVALWAENVAKLFDGSSVVFDANLLTPFVSSLSPVPVAHAEYFSRALSQIMEFVAGLDSQVNAPALRTTAQFRALLALADVARVSSREPAAQFLPEVLSDFLLIRSGRRPAVLVERAPEIRVVFREGALQCVLNRLLASLEEHGCTDVAITVFNRGRKIEMTLSTDTAKNLERAVAAVQDDALWPFLRQELFITDVLVDGNSVRLLMPFLGNDGSFVSAALIAYLQSCHLIAREEAEVVARLLHDLKNELIAYDLSLRRPQTDRTARHRAQLDASVHLDEANTLVQSLQGIRGSMLVPVPTLTSPRDFLKEYFLTRLGTVPNNIRMEPPRNLAEDRVVIPVDYVKRMLDNLLRNSVEAMPKGGEVGLDWTLSQSESVLYIALWDNGPGLDAQSIERVMAGEGLPSRKRQGSGLGLMSVQRMLAKLTGTLRVESSLGSGTYWQLCIPVDSAGE